MKNVVIIVVGILALVLVVVIFSGRSDDVGTVDVQTGATFEELSALEFKDYEGNTLTLADFKGKRLIVNAWAAWCPFCVKELPDFATVGEELGENVVIIAIDRAESLSIAKGFSDRVGVTDKLVMLLDSSDSFYRAIGGFSMPETIFVDVDGEIKEHKRGPMDVDEIRNRIQQIFGL